MAGEQQRTQFRDAGCTSEEAELLCRISEEGDTAALHRKLRMVRCRQLEEIHQLQRRMDRLDLLIRKTERG